MSNKHHYGKLEERIKKLEKTEEALNLIFGLSPDLLGTANHNTGYFTRVNHAWKIFGRSLEESIERPFLDLVHPDDQNATSHAVEAMQSGQYISQFENRYRCKDGSYKIIEWLANPAKSDGDSKLGKGTSFHVMLPVQKNRDIHDIVITDLDMPKMNGIELSNRILSQNTGIPIIGCTGFSRGLTPGILSETGHYVRID